MDSPIPVTEGEKREEGEEEKEGEEEEDLETTALTVFRKLRRAAERIKRLKPLLAAAAIPQKLLTHRNMGRHFEITNDILAEFDIFQNNTIILLFFRLREHRPRHGPTALLKKLNRLWDDRVKPLLEEIYPIIKIVCKSVYKMKKIERIIKGWLLELLYENYAGCFALIDKIKTLRNLSNMRLDEVKKLQDETHFLLMAEEKEKKPSSQTAGDAFFIVSSIFAECAQQLTALKGNGDDNNNTEESDDATFFWN